jgi:hypothetical protein
MKLPRAWMPKVTVSIIQQAFSLAYYVFVIFYGTNSPEAGIFIYAVGVIKIFKSDLYVIILFFQQKL